MYFCFNYDGASVIVLLSCYVYLINILFMAVLKAKWLLKATVTCQILLKAKGTNVIFESGISVVLYDLFLGGFLLYVECCIVTLQQK